MDYKYDAVVIGAGPAGAACGITLQKNKVSNCVIDKAVFPRQKTCAGLVTRKSYELIKSLLGDVPENTFCDAVSELKLYKRTEFLAGAKLDEPIHLVSRTVFDNALVERYMALGGRLLEGERGLEIDYDANSLRLSNGDVIRYKSLIFADGALSMAHKQLKVQRSRLAFGLETYVPAEKLDVRSVNIYFGYQKSGYVWIFPHGDMMCVGMGDWFDKRTDYRKILSGFLDELGVEHEGARYIGAFLPCGYTFSQEKLPGNVMLAGDAGGFTDPITGEGLYMAMKTGILAAEATLTDAPKAKYLSDVRCFRQIVGDGRRVQKLIYSPPVIKRLLDKVKGKHRLVKYYFENMVNEYRYSYRGITKLYQDYKNEE